MLDELCQAHGFAHGAEVLLDAIEDVDGGLRVVGAVGVPGQEAREVLDCAEGLVAADWVVLLGGVCCIQAADAGKCVDSEAGIVMCDQSLTGCCDELLVVAYRRVVDEGVGDHVGRLILSIVGVWSWCW